MEADYDGSAWTAAIVKDIDSGTASSSPSDFTLFKGKICPALLILQLAGTLVDR